MRLRRREQPAHPPERQDGLLPCAVFHGLGGVGGLDVEVCQAPRWVFETAQVPRESVKQLIGSGPLGAGMAEEIEQGEEPLVGGEDGLARR